MRILKSILLLIVVSLILFSGFYQLQDKLLPKTVTIHPIEYNKPCRNLLCGFRSWKTTMHHEWGTTTKYYVGGNEFGNSIADGEEICYISNPAIGLGAYKDIFKQP